MIGVAQLAKRGSDLVSVKDQAALDEEEEEETWALLCPDPHFKKYMPVGIDGRSSGNSSLKCLLMLR